MKWMGSIYLKSSHTGFRNLSALAATLLSAALLIIFVIIMGTPFLWMILTSLKPAREVLAIPMRFWPSKFIWQNYPDALSRFPLGRYFINSFIVSLTVTCTQLIFCSMSGYAFAKFKFAGKQLIFYLFLSGMMIPAELKMIPTYMYVLKLGVLDTYFSLTLPALIAPFGVFMMKQFMEGMPTDLLEASRIDGCGEFRIYMRVILPLCKPVLAALTIIVFMGQWNDFVWPLIAINSPNMRTLQLGISMFAVTDAPTEYHLLMAVTVVSVIPVAAVFVSLQKYFVQGIVMSGLKV
jgi:ABC-type glycerol-3-phosphate transport system permease component